MNPQLIIAAIIAALGFAGGFGSAWKIQAGIFNTKEHQRDQQTLLKMQQSAAADIRRLDNTIDAQRASTTRAVALRRDLDSSRSELERLRSAIAGTVPTASDAPGACVERTNTADQLLLECAADLTELAGKADRHANDAQTLMDAWPK